jgi:hypothetical protein
MDPLQLTGDLGIQKSGDQVLSDGNLLISMEGYYDYYHRFLREPYDYDNSMQLAMRQPGIQMIWNKRRMGMIEGLLDPLKEIAWIRFLLTAHPKSSNLWSQLFWVLTFSSELIDLDNIEYLDLMLDSGARILGNYSLWTFRLKYTRWQIQSRLNRGDSCASINNWLRLEIQKIQKWCRLHPNDHSGLSFLFTLLKLDEETDWKMHRTWLDSLMDFYPDRPSLKMHKKELERFLHL